MCVCCPRNIHDRLPWMVRLREQHCSLILEQSLSCCELTTRIHWFIAFSLKLANNTAEVKRILIWSTR